jgi:hypothetical protein
VYAWPSTTSDQCQEDLGVGKILALGRFGPWEDFGGLEKILALGRFGPWEDLGLWKI